MRLREHDDSVSSTRGGAILIFLIGRGSRHDVEGLTGRLESLRRRHTACGASVG